MRTAEAVRFLRYWARSLDKQAPFQYHVESDFVFFQQFDYSRPGIRRAFRKRG